MFTNLDPSCRTVNSIGRKSFAGKVPHVSPGAAPYLKNLYFRPVWRCIEVARNKPNQFFRGIFAPGPRFKNLFPNWIPRHILSPVFVHPCTFDFAAALGLLQRLRDIEVKYT